MRFGLFSNNRRPNRRLGEGWEQDIEEVRVADEAGFEEAWFSEHESAAEPLIARASAVTKRIMLGPAVRPLPFYHPIQVALDCNALDQLTNGRYMLGLGTGFRPHRIAWRGHDPAKLREMTRESLEVILRLLQTRPEPFDHNGTYWQGKGLFVDIPPVQLPHPPVAMSVSNSQESARLCGRLGLMMLTSDFCGNRHFRELGDGLMAGHVEGGRTPSREPLHACRVVYVAATDKQARDDMRQSYNDTIAWEVANTPWHQQERIPAGGTFADINFDYLVDSGNLFVGSADTVRQMIEAFHAEVGGFGTLLFHSGRDYATPEKVGASIRAFAKDVAPKLRGLGAEVAAKAAE